MVELVSAANTSTIKSVWIKEQRSRNRVVGQGSFGWRKKLFSSEWVEIKRRPICAPFTCNLVKVPRLHVNLMFSRFVLKGKLLGLFLVDL